MKLFKMAIQRGNITAPAMIVIAGSEEQAESIARNQSGLGRFDSWSFLAMEVKNKRK
jgi:hypothetical protein